jgi:hypothetical protein
VPDTAGVRPLTGGFIHTFLANARCGIPSTAKALSVNLTVTAPTTVGDLRVYPEAQAQGIPNTSVINFTPGQTRANNAIISLDEDREFAVYDDQAPGGSVHLIVDVNGYFE